MKKLLCFAMMLVAGAAMAKGMPSTGVNPLKDSSARYGVYNLTFVQKSVDATGMKVETETLKGVLFINSDNSQTVYVWNPKDKGPIVSQYGKYNKKNEFATAKLCTARSINLTVAGYTVDTSKVKMMVASFVDSYNNWFGVGTGSKTSLAGNMITYCTPGSPSSIKEDAYGTWKATLDLASSKIYGGATPVKNLKTGDKQSMRGNQEYILFKKGAASGPQIW